MALRRDYLMTCSLNKFKAALDEREHSYSALANLRAHFLKREELTPVQANKFRYLQRKMRSCVKEGRVSRRRVPGTGKAVEVEMEYKDTPDNKRKNRVGQKYKRVVYEGAEYVEHKQKKMRTTRISQPGPKVEGFTPPVRRNFWIEAMAKAKQNLGTDNFVVPFSEVKDPDDEKQVLGHKVYLEAHRIMKQLREEDAEARKQHDTEYDRLRQCFSAEEVDAILGAKTTREYKKLVKKYGPACYSAVMAIRAGKPWQPPAEAPQQEAPTAC